MLRRTVLKGIAATTASGLLPHTAAAETPLKIGISMPLTGAGFNAVGRQLQAALKFYMQQHGDIVAGRQIQITIRDDGGVADNARRLIQEMIVDQKVDILGIGITPTALAIAPLVTESKKATLVMSSGASITTTKSPYFVRAGFILAPQSWVLAEWAAKNGSKRIVTLVNDWAPGVEAETAFTTRFKQVGGEIAESIRIPLANPDFAPFLQRIGDIKPDTAFIYFPGTQAPIFAKQFAERGLARSGIKVIGPGDLTDDDDLNNMGDQMVGMITAGPYSAAHDSALNKTYVAGIQKANGFRPDFVSLGGYDGLHLIYEALKKTGGNSEGEALIAAMKGMAWESPRGPVSIDPDTRDIVSNIYIRKVVKSDGQLWSEEFETYPNVRDPMKLAAAK
ncbi:MAG TPA: ABC transporter substrate-binding protein [Xanthobacteraceae bacterium]|nr:ABC transporter substrate-binding protein [Xanthobacteraceae bacterium]